VTNPEDKPAEAEQKKPSLEAPPTEESKEVTAGDIS